MKHLRKAAIYKGIATLCLLSFFSAVVRAQESPESAAGTSTTIGHSTWYTQPWALVTGIALVLIIIVALVPTNSAGNNNDSDKLRT